MATNVDNSSRDSDVNGTIEVSTVEGSCSDEFPTRSPDLVLQEVEHESNNVSFAVGESFKSFEELKMKVKQYEVKNFVQFWIRDSRTVKSAQKRLTKKLNEKIVYYEVVFCCIHGGKKFKSKGDGKRLSS